MNDKSDTTNSSKVPKPTTRHVFLTSPRTASNLLMRLLNLEGQGAQTTPKTGYFWMPATYLRKGLNSRPMREWSAEEKKSIDDMEQKCFNDLLNYINLAEAEANIVMFKEHAMLLNHPFFESRFIHGDSATVGEPMTLEGYPEGISSSRSPLNQTILSDDFLETLKPTFLIRHPALSLPSLFRSVQHEQHKLSVEELGPSETSLFWPRKLLEFYEEHHRHGGQEPVVLDADDVMTSQKLMVKYAKTVGLNPDKLRFSWEKASQEDISKQPPVVQVMLSSLNASDKIDPAKVAGHVDISQEAIKWRDEFGEQSGRKLESYVRAAMDDYEYMRSKRFTL